MRGLGFGRRGCQVGDAVAGGEGDADKSARGKAVGQGQNAGSEGCVGTWVQEPVGVDSGRCDMGTEEDGAGGTVDSVDATAQRSCVVDEGGEACAGAARG